MPAISVKIPRDGAEGQMSILPWLAVGLSISVIIMMLLRAWEGWKLWKSWSNTATQPERGSDNGAQNSGEQPSEWESERKQ